MDWGVDPFAAELGTVFTLLRQTDTVRITAIDGGEVEFPAPDLREYLEHWFETEPQEDLYSAAFVHSRESLLSHHSRFKDERRDAPGLLAALLGLSPQERAAALRPESRYCTLELATLLLEGSRQVVYDSPQAAHHLAVIGSQIASCLSGEVYGSERVLDLRAYAAAVLGNTLRVAGDLREAAKSFHEARVLLQASTCVSLEAIEIDNLETSLRRDFRDFTGALKLSRKVVENFTSLHMVTQAIRALLKRAVIFENMSRPDQAVQAIQEADALAGSCPDSWTVLMLRHSRAFYLARAGRFDEAKELFDRIRPLYDQFARPLMTARRYWAEGLILQGTAEPVRAIHALERARDVFQANAYTFDAALVSLDLAAALADQGRYAEVRDLAAATYALLDSQGVHRDALAALAQFQQAAARERLDREVLRQIAQRLSRAAELRPLPA